MIRAYTTADKDAIVTLLRLNTPTYFAPEEEADLVRYLEAHQQEHFVWEENGQILGCGGSNWYPDSDDGRVSWYIVHPQAQGQGVGGKLLQHALQHLRSNPQTRRVIGRTSQFAEQFFAKGGFVTKRREKDYWASGYDLVYMVLEW